MAISDWWDRLLATLGTAGQVETPAPGRVLVTLPGTGGTRVVEIVMTPDEWDEMVSIGWGPIEPAAEHVLSDVLEPRPERFLVYENYALVPSDKPELPPDPELERLTALAREHPEGIGGWFASRDEERPS